DHLVHPQILKHARKAAERIEVGRIEHKDSQDKINHLLVQLAKDGKKVVRLTSGDPFVLGKGGEEAEYLRSQQIPFEIIPGIPSAIAVPAYAGIPITHGHLSTSFAVITEMENEALQADGEPLVESTDTLIFLIQMTELPVFI